MKVASATFEEIPKPSQAMNSGANATFGIVSMETSRGMTARSPNLVSPTSVPSTKPIPIAIRNA